MRTPGCVPLLLFPLALGACTAPVTTPTDQPPAVISVDAPRDVAAPAGPMASELAAGATAAADQGVGSDAPGAPGAPGANEVIGLSEAAHPAMRGEASWQAAPSATPPPIQGGTLLMASDGSAVASDPDHDTVHLVNLETAQVRSVVLDRGSEPGRLAEDLSGRLHVVLRRAGAIATIDLATAELLGTRPACPAPHGIAHEVAGDVLHVVCESGELVTLPAAGGAATRVLRLRPGLRDVTVDGDRLRVSHMKEAVLYEVDADGTVVKGVRPETVTSGFQRAELALEPGVSHTMEPAVAWRVRNVGPGKTLMVHQRGQADPIGVGADDVNGAPSLGGSAYGNPFDCAGIVQSTVSLLGPDGVLETLPAIAGMVLPVDAAMGPDGSVAIVAAGTKGLGAGGFSTIGQPTTSLLVISRPEWSSVGRGGCFVPGMGDGGRATADAGQAVAVAFAQDARIVVQSRTPNELWVFESEGVPADLASPTRIPLGPSSEDLGHDIYHLSTGAQLACASCHPGGGDDGRAWNFDGIGARRSQASNVGLEGTAPFHWDGTMGTLDALVAEVFVHRMGGTNLAPEQVSSLQRWIFALRPSAPIRAADDVDALRGRQLFESSEVGCTDCHSGPRLTNNESRDVGTGGVFQVPSLVGIGYRLPVMHDGCARTLRGRFDPACAGTKHGGTDQLDEQQLADLVAYLETL